MPSSEQVAAVYDFESVFECALQALMRGAGLDAFTTQDFGRTKDDGHGNQVPVIDALKNVPRVEIMFIPGAGQGVFRPLIVDDVEVPVETSFKGRYRLDMVTISDIRIHSAYRTRIRFFMHTALLGLNGVGPMTLHRLQRFYKDGGTSPTCEPQKNRLQTTLLFDVDFSIQDEAWDSLSS